MKKTICLIVSIVFLSNVTFAQNVDSREQLAFGLKAGINYSNIYDSQSENSKAGGKVGFAGGVFLSIPIGKFLGFQPEILLSQRGFTATGNYYTNKYEFKRTLNYLDIPLLFAFKPLEQLTILAGPQYSYLMSRRDVFSNSQLTLTQQQDFENDNIRKNTFCLTGGVDFNFNNLVFGLRSGWDVTNNKGDGTSETPRYKNVWLQASIGFRIY